jgi:hypothetical protein
MEPQYSFTTNCTITIDNFADTIVYETKCKSCNAYSKLVKQNCWVL